MKATDRRTGERTVAKTFRVLTEKALQMIEAGSRGGGK
jgi:hypothetical protein